jgi:hypothetical protein
MVAVVAAYVVVLEVAVHACVYKYSEKGKTSVKKCRARATCKCTKKACKVKNARQAPFCCHAERIRIEFVRFVTFSLC